MLRRSQQLGTLVALVVFATSAWSQTAQYAIPTASLPDDFSAYHRALEYAANAALANLTEISNQGAAGETISNDKPDPTVLHQFAQKYWNGNDEAVRRAVERVTQLQPLLSPILRAEGIPVEIAALVLVESAGQLTALSPKGARGIWQLMPDTGRRYGLTVNTEHDERLDVRKATRAAARYLRDLHRQFGNWPLVFAAYNAGERVVEKASFTAGSKDFVLLSGRRLIPAETRGYVPAVLAASNLFTGNAHLGAESRAIDLHPSPAVLYAGSVGEDQK
jgi:membrane-bound lytic murein transglycosylase B